jgi:hypothetical protein
VTPQTSENLGSESIEAADKWTEVVEFGLRGFLVVADREVKKLAGVLSAESEASQNQPAHLMGMVMPNLSALLATSNQPGNGGPGAVKVGSFDSSGLQIHSYPSLPVLPNMESFGLPGGSSTGGMAAQS